MLAAFVPPEIRHLDFGQKWIQDEVLTIPIFNTETREGYHFEMAVTDCYVTRWVDPIFERGPARPVRVLDDFKLQEKLRFHLGIELRLLGWLKAPRAIS
jgi:hypothetical protein